LFFIIYLLLNDLKSNIIIFSAVVGLMTDKKYKNTFFIFIFIFIFYLFIFQSFPYRFHGDFGLITRQFFAHFNYFCDRLKMYAINGEIAGLYSLVSPYQSGV